MIQAGMPESQKQDGCPQAGVNGKCFLAKSFSRTPVPL
jgi:hypothetical protein